MNPEFPFHPADMAQRLSLIAWGREREAMGMERAAVICDEVDKGWIGECASAIRAAIQQEKK